MNTKGITDALMENDQLEQLLLSNWTVRRTCSINIDIKSLAEGIAKLLKDAEDGQSCGGRGLREADIRLDEHKKTCIYCTYNHPKGHGHGNSCARGTELLLKGRQ